MSVGKGTTLLLSFVRIVARRKLLVCLLTVRNGSLSFLTVIEGEKYDSMWGAADADKVSKTVAHVLPTLHLNTDEAWDEDRDNQDLESGGVSRYCGEWSPTSFMHSIRYLWCGYKREEDIENCSENVKHFYIEQNALLEEYVACSLGYDLTHRGHGPLFSVFSC